MLALSVVVGGAYFASALSRVMLGDGITDPDTVLPILVHRLLPAAGQQLFALAIVSASLSDGLGSAAHSERQPRARRAEARAARLAVEDHRYFLRASAAA